MAADLKHVEFVNGKRGWVGQSWIDRWPEDIKRVIDAPETPSPVAEEPETATAVTDAPTGEKEKK